MSKHGGNLSAVGLGDDSDSPTSARRYPGVGALVTSRAAEIEAGRRIPPDLVKALRSMGVFRMFVPQTHGGHELDLPIALEVIEALAD